MVLLYGYMEIYAMAIWIRNEKKKNGNFYNHSATENVEEAEEEQIENYWKTIDPLCTGCLYYIPYSFISIDTYIICINALVCLFLCLSFAHTHTHKIIIFYFQYAHRQ